MAVTVGTGDLFSGGSATSGANSHSSLSQGSVGATLDLSNLRSIQGHTIYDGFQASDVLSFGDLISQTAQNSSKTTASIFAESVAKTSVITAQGIQDSVESINSTISEISGGVSNKISSFFSKISNFLASPVFLAGVGVAVFLFAYKTFKRGR